MDKTKLGKLKRWRFTAVAAFVLTIVSFSSMGAMAIAGMPLSLVDEHIHLDYAVTLQGGNLPYRGAEISDGVVEEWLCGVGHVAGSPAPCSNLQNFEKADLPSGKFSTAYIHFPTYFWAAITFSNAIVSVFPGHLDFLDGLRLFSALLSALGVGIVIVFAGLLGAPRSMQLVAGLLTLSASSLYFFGTVVNPSSAALLTGSLVAGTGMLWLRRGKGFIWLALSTALAGSIAFILTLPSIAFAIFIAVVLLRKRFKRVDSVTTKSQLAIFHWRQPLILLMLGFVPLFAWVAQISARATVPNSELYGFAPIPGKMALLVNVLSEAFKLHSPWFVYEESPALTNVVSFSRIMSAGIPFWLTTLIVGSLVFYLAYQIFERPEAVSSRPISALPGVPLLVASALFVLVSYPVILRAANAIVSGFDYPIVERYSMGLAPMLILLAVLSVRARFHAWILGVPAAIGFVTTILSGLSHIP